MTELEIIEYLKENRKKGIIFNFMPEDVKSWCEFNNTVLFIYEGSWLAAGDIAWFDKRHAYCLPEDYEPKPEFKAHYEEFEIDKDGFFRIKKGSDTIYYCWYNWQKFLDDNHDKYNNFGGWLFNDKIWCTNPHLTTNIDAGDGGLTDYVSKDEKCEPVMPTKIRFWRYRE